MRYEFTMPFDAEQDALPTLDRLERIREAAGLRADLCTYVRSEFPHNSPIERREGVWRFGHFPNIRPSKVPCNGLLIIAHGTDEEIATWKAALVEHNEFSSAPREVL